MNRQVNTSSRTKRTIINTISGMSSFLIILLATFIGRKVFADKLGAEFLGLNNFFTSVVSMLSLTEMGVGTAMLFFLYEPVSLKDNKGIKSLMQFYKKIYLAIGMIITALGAIATIFIHRFIDSTLTVSDIRLYFILFFLSTSVTYFWAYKKNLLYADQKSSIISVTRTISKVLVILIQTVILVATGNYALYLLLNIIGNIADNLMCSIIVDKQYPYIRDKDIVPVSETHKNALFKKIVPIFIYNVADYIVTSIPTIFISATSLITSGLYSNYILITSTLRATLGSIFAAFTFSFGNLAALESDKKCYEVFEKIDFMAYWIVSTCTVVFINLIQPFICLWVGSDFQLSFLSSILIGINFYCVMMNVPAVSVQNALGLHHHDQYANLGYALVSVILTVILGNNFDLPGIVSANIISIILFPTITKPYVIYKNVFHVSPSKYYINYVKRFLLLGFMLVGTFYSIKLITIENAIFSFIIQGVISFFIPTLILFVLYAKTEEFKYYLNLAKQYLTRR